MVDQFEKLADIGNGSFGKVCKIRRKSDGKILVWKELNYGKMSEKEKQQLVSEVNILRELTHPNIVKYYDRIIDKPNAKIYIIMEYCEGGDLQQIIRRCRKQQDHIAEDVIWKILTQITLGLYQCHRRQEAYKINNNGNYPETAPPKILHRDLKPGNIFLDSNSNVKIGDFGLARAMNQESQFAYTHVGTPYYMSPEQINESKYNEQSDIWSLGCIIYEMASLHPPFTAQNHLSLAMKIKAGKFERIPNRYSEELQRVVSWMLSQNSQDRPTVEDLMNLPQISLRIRERKIQETVVLLKQKEQELRSREEKLQEKEQQIKERESQLIEREQVINEIVMKGGCAVEQELLQSLQRLASTRAGESSLAASERVSLGSKLKESKMSGLSFSGFDNSIQKSHNKQTLHKFKSDPEFMSVEEAQKLLQSKVSNRSNNEDEDSMVSRSNLQKSSGNGNQKNRTMTKGKIPTNNIQLYPERGSMERRYNTQPDKINEDEEAEYNFRGSDDEQDEQVESDFRQTVFNPQAQSNKQATKIVNQQKQRNQQLHNSNSRAFKTFDERDKVQKAKSSARAPANNSNLQKEVVQKQEDLQQLKQQINMIPLPQRSNHNSNQLNHAPSMETLLSKKLNESTTKMSQKQSSCSRNGQQQVSSTQRSFARQESLEKLAACTGNSFFLQNNMSFEKTKNQTQNIMNVTSELSRYIENVNPQNNQVKQIKRCPSAAKQRPPLTDRTNIVLSQKYQSNQAQKQQLPINDSKNNNQVINAMMAFIQQSQNNNN